VADPSAILDECIRAVRSGEKSIDECVECYPQYRREIECLVPVACAIRPGEASLDQSRRLALRHAFVEAIAEKRAELERPSPWRRLLPGPMPGRLRLAAFAVNLLAVLIVTTSAASAARDAQPGDLLYVLKTGIEQVQIATAVTPDARAGVRLQIAAERLKEVQAALTTDRVRAASAAATAYADTMDQAQRDAEAARATGRPVDSLRAGIQANLQRQEAVKALASEKGAASTTAAIERVKERQATQALTPVDDASTGVAPSSSAPPGPTSMTAPSAASDGEEALVVPDSRSTATPAALTATPTPTEGARAVATGATSARTPADLVSGTSGTGSLGGATATLRPSATPTRWPTWTLPPTQTGTATPSPTATPSIALSSVPQSLGHGLPAAGRGGRSPNQPGVRAALASATSVPTSTPTPVGRHGGGRRGGRF